MTAMAADLSNPSRLTGAQARPAAEVFARAFHDEPLYCHIVPDVDVRKDVLPHLFEFRIRYGVLYGEVHVTSSNLEGVAVWIPSDKVRHDAVEDTSSRRNISLSEDRFRNRFKTEES